MPDKNPRPDDEYENVRWLADRIEEDEGQPATLKETAVALSVLIAALAVFVSIAIVVVRAIERVLS